MPQFGVTPEEKKGLLYGALISAALRGVAGASRGEGGIGSVIGGAATGLGAYGEGLGNLTKYKNLIEEENRSQAGEERKAQMFPYQMQEAPVQLGIQQQNLRQAQESFPLEQELRQSRVGATKALTEQRGQPHLNQYISYRNSLVNELNNPLTDLTDEERLQNRQIVRQLDAQILPLLPQGQGQNLPLSLHTSPGGNPKANILNFINRR